MTNKGPGGKEEDQENDYEEELKGGKQEGQEITGNKHERRNTNRGSTRKGRPLKQQLDGVQTKEKNRPSEEDS